MTKRQALARLIMILVLALFGALLGWMGYLVSSGTHSVVIGIVMAVFSVFPFALGIAVAKAGYEGKSLREMKLFSLDNFWPRSN